MVTKRMKQTLWACVVLALLVGLGLAIWCQETPISYVSGTQLDGTDIYGMDRQEDSFVFFHTDETGLLLGDITHAVLADGVEYSFEDIIQDGSNLYTLGRATDVVSRAILSEVVYLCNFEEGTLIPYYDLPVKNPSQHTNLGVTVHGGTIYSFQSDYTGMVATTTLYKATTGQNMRAVTQFTFDIGVGFTDFYVSPTEQILFTTPTGAAYLLDEQGEALQIFPTGGEGSLAYVATNNSQLVHLITTAGAIYKLDMETQDLSYWITLDYAMEPTIELSAYAYDEKDNMLLVTQQNQITRYGVKEGDISSFQALTVEPNVQRIYFGIGLCGTLVLALLVYLLYRLLKILFGGKVPIVTKLLAAFLPILLLSLYLMNLVVTSFFTNQLVDNQFKQLYLLTSQYTATLNANYIENIDLDSAHDDIYFYQIRSALNVLPDSGTLTSLDGSQQDVHNASYFWLYKVEDGQLLSLICEQDYIGVPVERRYSFDVATIYYAAVANKETVRTTTLDSYGEWTVLLTPIFNEAGEVVALLEAGDGASTLNYAVDQGATQLRNLNLTVMLGLAVLLSAVIAFSLHPLKALKKRVEEISDGQLGVQTKVRGHDEVAEISRVFNTMSHNVAFRDNEIRMTSDGYSRFVPAEVFQLLDKHSVIDVQLADQTNMEATVLSCAVSSFDQMARSMGSKQMFTLINEVLDCLVPTVEGSGGLVDRFDRAGLLAIYTSRPEGAPDAAIALFRILRTAELPSAQGQPLDFHAVISSGAAMIGIVGAGQRLEAMTISEHTNFTKFLRPLAIEQGAHILATASALEQIPGFESRYHARIIGYVRMKSLERVERLYDVYDGADEVTFSLKEETKPLFEKGVELFCSGAFYDARLLFIEVLKKHREDKAAQKYLYLCDEAFRMEGKGEHDPCIATY